MNHILNSLAGFDRPWWVAGGQAVSLHVCREVRQHHDIDIALLGRDADVAPRALRALVGVDVLYEDSDGETWRYRLDPRIELPLATVIRRNDAGVPYQSPEVTLL